MKEIVHDRENCRFTLTEEGRTAWVEYRREPGRMNIIHTIVPAPLQNRGIAARLVEAACNYATAHGLQSVADCSYARRWIERHPQSDAPRE